MADLVLRFRSDSQEAVQKVREMGTALGGVEVAAGDAGDALRGTGKGADDAAKKSVELERAVAEMRDQLASATKRSDELAAELKTLKERQEEAGQAGEGFATKLDHITNLASKLGQVAGLAFQSLAEGIQRSAESGDESSKALVRDFGEIRDGADGIYKAFAKDLAPAMKPIVEGFKEISGSLAEWIDKQDLGRKAALVMLDTQIALMKANDSLAPSFKAAGQALDGAFAPDKMKARSDAFQKFMQGPDPNYWRQDVTEDTKRANDFVAAISGAGDATAHLSEATKALIAERDRIAKGEGGGLGDTSTEEERAQRIKEAQEEQAAYDRLFYEEQQAREEDRDRLSQHAIERADAEAQAVERSVFAQYAVYEDFWKKFHAAAEKAHALRQAQLKKEQADELKAKQESAAKTFAIAQTAAQQLIGEDKKLGQVLLQQVSQYTQGKIATLGQGVQQELALLSTASSAKEREAILQAMRDKGGMAASFAAAFAPLGPFAVPAAAAAIAAMSALVNKFATSFHFADGGRVQDRVPGLGRADTVPGVLGAKEGVLTEDGMNTRIGDVLGAINRGLSAGGQGGGGGGVTINLGGIHIMGPVLDSPERYAVELGPVLSRALNIWVRDFGGQLYATGLAEGRGR